MLLYLDTNVVLARYAPGEPRHDEAKILLNRIERGELSAVTSVLSLVEVVCATSRAYERFDDRVGELGQTEVAGAFLRRVVNINNLEFIPMGGEISVNVTERQVKLPALFALALEIGAKTGVKTLDTLHLASASIASRIYGQKIDYFVTLDEDILKRREDISGLIECKVVSLAEQF
ncbi:MAG: type II toxin-antitoxin system VapC family toxin [Candidatus Bathyarchaeia archaeon]